MPIGLGFTNIDLGASAPVAAGGAGWLDLATAAAGAIGSYFQSRNQTAAPFLQNPGAIYGLSGAIPAPSQTGLLNVNTAPMLAAGGSCGAGTCGTPFRSSGTRVSAQDFWMTGPDGRMRLFGPLGRVLLTSRDLRAAKKVGRLASRASRARPRRRSYRRR